MDAREARMDSSETQNLMMGRNSYGGGGGVPNNSMMMQHSGPMIPRLFNIPSSSKPMDGSSTMCSDGVPEMRPCVNMGEPTKKKRGRPRKYGGADGSKALALYPISSSHPGFSNPNSSPMSDPNTKRRGRPPGAGKKQQLDALGSAGIAFTPHVITVKAGEDVASKIMAFSQQGPRTVCILSANGAICNVTLRQPATSGGTVTYEGRFEIISLSGSFLLTENGGTRSRTGGLSVALAGPDGRVLGGGVAGMLMAATPVQVVMGSFIAEGKKPKPEEVKREPSVVPPMQTSGFVAASASSPPSEGMSSESDDDDDDDPGSPSMNQSTAVENRNNTGYHFHGMPGYSSVRDWPHTGNQQRHDAT